MTQGPKELEARIARLFVEQLQVDLSSSEVDLFESGLLDSWRLVVLLGALETDFGCAWRWTSSNSTISGPWRRSRAS